VEELDLPSDPLPVGEDTFYGVPDVSFFYLQSEEVGLTHYVDENEGLTVGRSASEAGSTVDATVGSDISDFFSRPVRIDTRSWLESDVPGVLGAAINPWSLWATNTYVKNKLNNYAFFRGNLHVKIVINASPFYYGMVQVSYLPRQTDKPTTVVVDTGLRYLIPFSQRPRLVLDPQRGEAGELVAPFIYTKNFLDCTTAADFAAMGVLDYLVYSQLQSANGVSGTGITITTYAWATEVTLSGPTVAFAAQSEFIAQSDEYGEGCVSKPASQIAGAATYFEQIPIIGPFATATRIGASAVSAIARLFGFTNVPVIADTIPQRPEAFPKFANSEIGFPLEKLTLDPKNELSVDPRVVGMPTGNDEMMISSIAMRESYLTSVTWATTDAVDAVLFWSRVNPKLYDNDNGALVAGQQLVYMTPMCMMANMFDHWRGDIIFKFKVVASKYHKGRLRISFDPSKFTGQDLSTVVQSTNIVRTAIVDIGETNEIEFRIPYQQALQFLVNRPSLSAANKGWAANTAFGVYPADSNFDNGAISLRVLNILTAPVASSNIKILVYVRAAENIEFANPTPVDPNNTLSPFVPQSQEFREETTELSLEMGKTKTHPENQYTVYFGENIRSLRQLMRRYELHSTKQYAITPVDGATNRYLKNWMYPPPTSPGFISTGTETAFKIVGTGATGYNFCFYTMIAYVSNAFLCYRGSINWSFNTLTDGVSLPEIKVERKNAIIAQATYSVTTASATAPSATARELLFNTGPGTSGQAITNCNTQSGFNVALPMYSGHKFHYCVPGNANLGVSTDGSGLEAVQLESMILANTNTPDTTVIQRQYVSIGTDYSLHFFLNVPVLWIYSAVPNA
jgi:hypothetical protein